MLYLEEPNSIYSPANVIFGHSFDPVVILKLCYIAFYYIVDACGCSLDERELAMLSWDIRRIVFEALNAVVVRQRSSWRCSLSIPWLTNTGRAAIWQMLSQTV
jgi:hypothetical protein